MAALSVTPSGRTTITGGLTGSTSFGGAAPANLPANTTCATYLASFDDAGAPRFIDASGNVSSQRRPRATRRRELIRRPVAIDFSSKKSRDPTIEVHPVVMAVDGTHVYWGNHGIGGTDGAVMRCAVGGCNGAPEQLATNVFTDAIRRRRRFGLVASQQRLPRWQPEPRSSSRTASPSTEPTSTGPTAPVR